jgi:DNA-binding transcriptional regulator LsrR (DeoR family)
MVVLNATYKNGIIQLEQPLPEEFEGKQIQVTIEAVQAAPRKRRQAGSAAGQIIMSPDFDTPLDEF